MNLPNLPTDNLYKFMALSGIIMIIFFLSAFLTTTFKINEIITEVENEINLFEEEVKTYNKLIVIIDERIKELESRKKSEKIDAELYKLRLSAHNENKKMKLKSIKINNLNTKGKNLYKTLDKYAIIFSIGIVLGLFLSIEGFKLWYKKVQKYLDINIQKE